MKVTGACHCGAITIEGEADPEKVTVCHCTDCQTGTGSAFRVSVPIPGTVFKMKGRPTNYVKTSADSGNPRVQAFCGQCGSPIFSALVEPAGVLAVKAGTLDDRSAVTPTVEVWCDHKQPWVDLPGMTASLARE